MLTGGDNKVRTPTQRTYLKDPREEIGTASELNFSKATAGSLKDSQWRQMCKYYALIPNFNKSENSRLSSVFDNNLRGRKALDGCRTNEKQSSPCLTQLIQSTNICVEMLLCITEKDPGWFKMSVLTMIGRAKELGLKQ